MSPVILASLSARRSNSSVDIILQFLLLLMPLVVMCGTPASGKSTRATEIANYLTQKHQQQVIIVNEQSCGIVKNEGYASAEVEKMTRGKIKFQVEKNLIGKTIVIADSMNYIKGFRYQMYCIAREQKTTYCVVYCNSDKTVCLQYNAKNKNNFSEELFQSFTKRMERPQLKNRWDIPLFERREDEPTPVEEITDVLLFQEKKSKDPVSTKQEQKLSEDYLSELDQLMQQINEQALLGNVKLMNNWSAVQLKKLKKSFVNIAKEKPQSLKVLKQAYMNYLLENDKRK